MQKLLHPAWTGFGPKVAAWLLASGLAWLLPWIFLDEPIDYPVPGILFVVGVHPGFFEPTKLPIARSGQVKKGLGFLWILPSFWSAIPGAPEVHMPWQPYSDEALSKAHAAGRPVLIDFCANWSPPCRFLERKVFLRKNVVEAARRFAPLKADVTDTNSALALRLAEKYQLDVLSAGVFLGRDGTERSEFRLLGCEGSAEFIRRMQAVKQADLVLSSSAGLLFTSICSSLAPFAFPCG